MSDHWNTPEDVLERVRRIAPIGLDPCGNPTSIVNAAVTFTYPEQDGLVLPWGGYGLVFENCPFSQCLYRRFAAKTAEEASKGTELVYLVPANVETKAWADWWKAQAVCFPDKRIKYLENGKPVGSPRFASAVGYFGPRKMTFWDAFKDYGKVVFP